MAIRPSMGAETVTASIGATAPLISMRGGAAAEALPASWQEAVIRAPHAQRIAHQAARFMVKLSCLSQWDISCKARCKARAAMQAKHSIERRATLAVVAAGLFAALATV